MKVGKTNSNLSFNVLSPLNMFLLFVCQNIIGNLIFIFASIVFVLHASLGYFNLPPLLQEINGINFLKDLLKGEELSDDSRAAKKNALLIAPYIRYTINSRSFFEMA